MNAYKLNSQSGYILRCAIANNLKIPFEEIYRQVKTVEGKMEEIPRIQTKDGKIYEIVLKEIK